MAPVDSGKTFFDISFKIDQIDMGLKQIPLKKWQQHALVCDFQTKIWLLVNNFLTRSLSESH